MTTQPLPVIIGELDKITGCYICVNEIRYKVESPLKAVDVCFKIFHALNAEYPKECDSTWMFIQEYMYGITTKFDRKYVAVSSLISDIELILSNK